MAPNPVTLRLPQEILNRAERLVKELPKLARWSVRRLSRSAVLREAVLKGLALLELQAGLDPVVGRKLTQTERLLLMADRAGGWATAKELSGAADDLGLTAMAMPNVRKMIRALVPAGLLEQRREPDATKERPGSPRVEVKLTAAGRERATALKEELS